MSSPKISVFHNGRDVPSWKCIRITAYPAFFSASLFLDLLHTSITDYSPIKWPRVHFWAISLSPTNSSVQIPTQQFPAPLQPHLPFPSGLQLLLLTEFIGGKMYSCAWIGETASFMAVEDLITKQSLALIQAPINSSWAPKPFCLIGGRHNSSYCFFVPYKTQYSSKINLKLLSISQG